MTEKITLRPLTFSITYGKMEIKDYLEECEEDEETPTQEGFNLYAMRCFNGMLEDRPDASYFERKIEESGWEL